MEANPINILIGLAIIFVVGIISSKGFKRNEGSGKGSSKKTSSSESSDN